MNLPVVNSTRCSVCLGMEGAPMPPFFLKIQFTARLLRTLSLQDLKHMIMVKLLIHSLDLQHLNVCLVKSVPTRFNLNLVY